MSISPIYKGSTPLLYNTFAYDNGTLFPLSGLSPTSFKMYFVQNQETRLGTGTFTNLNTSTSSINYQMSAADTATAGPCDIFCVVTLSNDTRPFDPQQIVIEDLHIP